MTPTEFKEWLTYYQGYFGGWEAWLFKMYDEESGKNGKPSRAVVIRQWAHTLRHVELEAAKGAVERMYGDMDLRPKNGHRDHPSVIARLAAGISRDRAPPENRPTYHDGEKTVRCKLCRDDGRLTVYARSTLVIANRTRQRQVKKGEPVLGEFGTIRVYVVRCACKHNNWPLIDDYDPAHDLIELSDAEGDRVNTTQEEELQRITDFAATALAPPKHEEFEAFG